MSFNLCKPKVQQLLLYPLEQCSSDYRSRPVAKTMGNNQHFLKNRKSESVTCNKGKYCFVKFLFQCIIT